MAGALGLGAPLGLSPVPRVQVVDKVAFLLGVVLPLAATGGAPGYAVPVVGMFVLFVGNPLAIPTPSVLSRPAATSVDRPGATGFAPGVHSRRYGHLGTAVRARGRVRRDRGRGPRGARGPAR